MLRTAYTLAKLLWSMNNNKWKTCILSTNPQYIDIERDIKKLNIIFAKVPKTKIVIREY